MTMADQELFTIGEVVALLKPDCEISESNLRFWEKQGLLLPQRTPGGHRLYAAADIARIKLIKRMQADRYLPLSAIKHLCANHPEALDDMAPFFEALYRPRHYEADFQPLSAAALALETGLAPEVIEALFEAGALTPGLPADSDSERLYDEDDRQICRLMASVIAEGFPVAPMITKAGLVRQHVQDEWDQVVCSLKPVMVPMPLQTKMRVKGTFEALEALLFNNARRRLRQDLLHRGALDHPACHPTKET